MRAKRSKKYRKIINTYQLHFSFREPYQVLMTADFLRAAHAFSMPLQKFLENTLHGKVLPYITQCSLAKMMEGFSGKGRDGRPTYLPPPTEVPLRYCKHKDAEGSDLGVIPESQCLFDLISGQPKGNEMRKNKQHFILAAADYDEGVKDEKEKQKIERTRGTKRKAGELDPDVRPQARTVPGVPIIYVKRSVMILEEPSTTTERVVRGIEKDKMTEGLIDPAALLKRKRADGEDGDDSEEEHENERQGGPKLRGLQKARGPNPLSMKKKRRQTNDGVSSQQQLEGASKAESGSGDSNQKSKRRGKRSKRGTGGGEHDGSGDGEDAITAASRIQVGGSEGL